MPSIVLYVPSLRGGGAERVIVNLSEELVRKGHDVTILVNCADKVDYSLADGVKLISLNVKRSRESILKLATTLQEIRPVTVMSALTYANFCLILAVIIFRIPVRVVVSEHAAPGPHWLAKYSFLKRILTSALAFILYPLADKCIAVSSGVANEFSRISPFSASKWEVIGNPIPSFRDSIVMAPLHGNILAAGRLDEEKGFDILIRAYALASQKVKLPSLIIVGEGPERKRLEMLIQGLNLSNVIALPGFTKDINDYYRNARLFVLSSRWEGFGNVLVEAMSFGVPIVSTDCPYGPRDILEGGRYGILVEVNNIEMLSQALIAAVSQKYDPEILVKRAKRFSPDIIADEYEAVLVGRSK